MTEKQIGLMMHALGLDNEKPRKRNGKYYYKAYRNRYMTGKMKLSKVGLNLFDSKRDADDDVAEWDDLVSNGYAKRIENTTYYYQVTHKGMDALAEVLGYESITEE